MENRGVWPSAGLRQCGRSMHKADHTAMLSTDSQAAKVFHWINIVISNAKAFIDGASGAVAPAANSIYRCPSLMMGSPSADAGHLVTSLFWENRGDRR